MAAGFSWAAFGWTNDQWQAKHGIALDLPVYFKLWAGIRAGLTLHKVIQSPAGLPGSHCTQWAYNQHSPAGQESRLMPDLPLSETPTCVKSFLVVVRDRWILPGPERPFTYVMPAYQDLINCSVPEALLKENAKRDQFVRVLLPQLRQ